MLMYNKKHNNNQVAIPWISHKSSSGINCWCWSCLLTSKSNTFSIRVTEIKEMWKFAHYFGISFGLRHDRELCKTFKRWQCGPSVSPWSVNIVIEELVKLLQKQPSCTALPLGHQSRESPLHAHKDSWRQLSKKLLSLAKNASPLTNQRRILCLHKHTLQCLWMLCTALIITQVESDP